MVHEFKKVDMIKAYRYVVTPSPVSHEGHDIGVVWARSAKEARQIVRNWIPKSKVTIKKS
jgi:exosome complex RNA-binding protein Csl4